MPNLDVSDRHPVFIPLERMVGLHQQKCSDAGGETTPRVIHETPAGAHEQPERCLTGAQSGLDPGSYVIMAWWYCEPPQSWSSPSRQYRTESRHAGHLQRSMAIPREAMTH